MDRIAGFLVALWRSGSRPKVLSRCLVIAAVVGTALTLVNNLDAILGTRADPALGWRVLANYVTPFIVSNLGAMAPSRKDE